MKIVKSLTFGIAAALAMVGTLNADVSYALNSSAGVTSSSGFLTADHWYQVWWSADTTTIFDMNAGDVQVGTAGFTTLGSVDPASLNSSGDYLVLQGGTPGGAGFAGSSVAATVSNADVGGNNVDLGTMYAILYYEPVVPKGSTTGLATAPPVGASAMFSEIKLVSTMLTYVNGSPAPPANTDASKLDFPGTGSNNIDDGSHSEVIADVVPEPGTMALFALGIATIAWRRRKK